MCRTCSGCHTYASCTRLAYINICVHIYIYIYIYRPSGGRTFCRKAPAAEISAKKTKKRRPQEKTPKRNKHSDMLKPASAKFRRFPAEFRRFPAEFRRFPAACFAPNLILKKTLPGKLKTPPTAKRRLFPKRQKLLPIWVVHIYIYIYIYIWDLDFETRSLGCPSPHKVLQGSYIWLLLATSHASDCLDGIASNLPRMAPSATKRPPRTFWQVSSIVGCKHHKLFAS